MPAVRSPNYPALDLGGALALVEKAFKSENRNKMSQAVLAGHMGYNSLNGRALSRIGAVRAYGLVEGRGDELKVSDDAITALMASADERKGALERLSTQPALFKQLRADFPETLPSDKNLAFHLVKRKFTPEAAGKAAKTYLATMRLVSANPESYSSSEQDDEEDSAVNLPTDNNVAAYAAIKRPARAAETPPATAPLRVIMNGNRLDIQASVDLEGLEKLELMLAKYKEILKMMQ